MFVGLLILVLLVGCTQQGTIETIEKNQTKISLENNGLNVEISPTNNKEVKGVITIKLISVPPQTTKVLISLAPQGFKGDLYNSSNVIIQWIENPSNGQEILLDTTKVENGVYGIGVGATYEGAPESSPWIALVQTQVNVQN